MNRSRTDLTRRRRDSPRLPSGRGRPLPRWCVGLALVCCALLLGSCAAPGAQLGASPTAGPAQQTAVADQLEELRRQLRELQPTVERRHRVRFPLAAPTDFAGLTPETPTANAPPGPPVVGIRLVDPRDGRRWIGVTQSIGGLGAWDMPMVGQATVRGAPAQLLASPDGTTVAVAWGRDGVSYAVTGVGVPREAVLRVAESLEPVR